VPSGNGDGCGPRALHMVLDEEVVESACNLVSSRMSGGALCSGVLSVDDAGGGHRSRWGCSSVQPRCRDLLRRLGQGRDGVDEIGDCEPGLVGGQGIIRV